jgi:hypothetical protein
MSGEGGSVLSSGVPLQSPYLTRIGELEGELERARAKEWIALLERNAPAEDLQLREGHMLRKVADREALSLRSSAVLAGEKYEVVRKELRKVKAQLKAQLKGALALCY